MKFSFISSREQAKQDDNQERTGRLTPKRAEKQWNLPEDGAETSRRIRRDREYWVKFKGCESEEIWSAKTLV